MGEVLDTSSSASRVVRAIQLVEQLRAEGLSKAEESQPLRSFTKWQRDFLRQRLDFVAQQHVEAVMSVRDAAVRSPNTTCRHFCLKRPLPSRSADGLIKCQKLEDRPDPRKRCASDAPPV